MYIFADGKRSLLNRFILFIFSRPGEPKGFPGFVFFVMNDLYSILMQKETDGAEVKDSLADFGVALTEADCQWGGEVKELASRDWDGEDGEDTYIPSVLPLEAYDAKFELACKGSDAYGKMMTLRSYLTGTDGSGAELRLYTAWGGWGRKGVYLKKIEDAELHYSAGTGWVMEFSATFRVTDPRTEIVPASDSAGTVLSLVEKT